MGLVIPNAAIATTFGYQADWYASQVDAISNAFDGSGVRSGCQVTAQTVPNMTVKISQGCISVGGRTGWLGAVASQTIGGASANPRIDLVVATLAAGATVATASVVPGTATNPAVSDPPMPAIPANSVVLAAVAVGTSTTTITNGPPGNIWDQRIPIAGALQGDWVDASDYVFADGATDQTAGWGNFISAIPTNGTGYIPKGIYAGLVVTKSDINIVGAPGATLLANGISDTMCMRIDAAFNNVSVRGLKFDGADNYGGICIGGSGSGAQMPNNIVIEQCEFTRFDTQGRGLQRHFGISSFRGPRNSRITNNWFHDSGGGGICLTTPTMTQIVGNRFYNVGYGNGSGSNRQDFIYCGNGGIDETISYGFAFGKGLLIQGNIGERGFRNLIEIQGLYFEGGQVKDNILRFAENQPNYGDQFGISVPNLYRGMIKGNTVIMPNTLATVGTAAAQYDVPMYVDGRGSTLTTNTGWGAGIEAFQGHMTIEGNSVFGFGTGIIFTGNSSANQANKGERLLVIANRIEFCDNGIEFANDVSKDYHYIDIFDNHIHNCRLNGITDNQATVWGGARIRGNQIHRTVGYGDDTTHGYTGIGLSNNADAHVEIKDNFIFLGAGLSLGGWNGISTYGTTNFRNEISGNTIEYAGSGTLGNGIYCNTNLPDYIMRRNRFVKMAVAIAGLSPTTRGVWELNINEGSGESNTPSGFWGIGIPPLAHSLTPTFKYFLGHAAAIPTTGTYNAGDYMEFTAPAAAGWMGAICVTGGSPGIWKRWGAIEA